MHGERSDGGPDSLCRYMGWLYTLEDKRGGRESPGFVQGTSEVGKLGDDADAFTWMILEDSAGYIHGPGERRDR